MANASAFSSDAAIEAVCEPADVLGHPAIGSEVSLDDGKLSGRGRPLIRGLASGLMTALGGLGHALPYLIPDFWTATSIATVVVFFELWAISWIRWKYMDTPFLRAAFQVAVGGFFVFLTGIFIGSA